MVRATNNDKANADAEIIKSMIYPNPSKPSEKKRAFMMKAIEVIPATPAGIYLRILFSFAKIPSKQEMPAKKTENNTMRTINIFISPP